ncbi:antA/AntB antirepressor family protein [Jeotgalibacillus haloalkalitolerans]|uniref:AntA/AntB antirepressor family protein n=1 Tax=Jeotgalibacillus haloalkalitolerans TaxID=3104292 RepID=A0ABU5KKC5_9BACL|nr:antA/AntB antirepressor family protein [Jeotgalibacillus sp. HH7-29]MDZ5711617.1 antA/AntB antirepressor family protein [Jeotgalibacillus sp. HH7-29]
MNGLKLIDDEMLPVYETDKGEKVVFARELHELLFVQRDFSTWIKERISRYGFIEGEDFSPVSGNGSTTPLGATKGRPKIDYILILDTAKEIAMVENNEMGRAVRRKFIAIEKRLREENKKPTSQLEVLQVAVNQLVAQQEKIDRIEQQQHSLQQESETLKHRIDTFDRIDPHGDEKQRLVKMIQKYAGVNGIRFDQAWREFRSAYNTAYRTNITMLIENYKMKHGFKDMTLPQYLSLTGQLQDGLRVADKLLNPSQRSVL